jgi:hypothetical protein
MVRIRKESAAVDQDRGIFTLRVTPITQESQVYYDIEGVQLSLSKQMFSELKFKTWLLKQWVDSSITNKNEKLYRVYQVNRNWGVKKKEHLRFLDWQFEQLRKPLLKEIKTFDPTTLNEISNFRFY